MEQVDNPVDGARARFEKLRQRATTGQVRIVHILFGYAAANRFFWVAPRKGKPTWTDVQNRVEWLHGRNPAAAADFAATSLAKTTIAGVVVGLARHPASQETTRAWLTAVLGNPASVRARIIPSGRLAGAIAAAGRLVLERDAARALVDGLMAQYDVVPLSLFQAMDTVGYRFTASDELDARLAMTSDVRHRLIITEELEDRRGMERLVAGAKRATLLATTDTYGQAKLDKFRKAIGGGDVAVEHVRSRITRFSQEYIDLHEATARLARVIGAELLRDEVLADPAYRQLVEVQVADYLFFAALRMMALHVLLDDEAFDHVVVAVGDNKESDAYIRQLAAVERLHRDPRTELVLVSGTQASFRNFWALADEIAFGHRRRSADPRTRMPADVIMAEFLRGGEAVAGTLPVLPASERNVLLATTNSPAYNTATAGYVDALRDWGTVSVVHCGPDAGPLPGLLQAPLISLAPDPPLVGSLPFLLAERVAPIVMRLDPGQAALCADRVAWAAATADIERMCRRVGVFLLNVRTTEAWFDRLAAEGALPDVVVVTPQRHTGASAVAVAARRRGIPSVAVEPHAQDANYARYMKVGADYYGVLSDYFRDQAIAGFGIDAERIRALGSPRQIAPANFDRRKAHVDARNLLQQDHGLTLKNNQFLLGFFSQPSSWEGIRPVWSAVLEATRETGSKVLLKPHPEDSPSRIRQYLAAAEKDEVLVFRGDVTTAIDASDVVTTTYSIVGMDATLRRAPVVALADGDAKYPLDLASILGVPVVRSAAELAKTIESFKADPSPFTERPERFLAEESQFVEGPGPRLCQLLDEVVQQGASGIRPAADVPEHYFLDGPHPVFPV